MPLYEYHCSKCDKTFEVIQKFSDEPLTEHENCGGRVERLLSAPAFQLKGTGWYVTDYAKSGGKDSDAGSEKKSESKSAPAEARSGEGKSGEAKSGEGKSAETKAGDSKPGPAKSESKAPAAKNSD